MKYTSYQNRWAASLALRRTLFLDTDLRLSRTSENSVSMTVFDTIRIEHNLI